MSDYDQYLASEQERSYASLQYECTRCETGHDNEDQELCEKCREEEQDNEDS